jgi:hypothetical protein
MVFSLARMTFSRMQPWKGDVELVKRLMTLEEVKIDLPNDQRAG